MTIDLYREFPDRFNETSAPILTEITSKKSRHEYFITSVYKTFVLLIPYCMDFMQILVSRPASNWEVSPFDGLHQVKNFQIFREIVLSLRNFPINLIKGRIVELFIQRCYYKHPKLIARLSILSRKFTSSMPVQFSYLMPLSNFAILSLLMDEKYWIPTKV